MKKEIINKLNLFSNLPLVQTITDNASIPEVNDDMWSMVQQWNAPQNQTK